MAMGANAENSGYWRTSDGALVMSGNRECWHGGNWTPALAIAECDPNLMPKTAAPPAAPVTEARAEPVDAAPPVPVAEKIAMDTNVLFDFDASNIKPEGKAALDEVIRKLSLAGAELRLIVSTGHTDSTGTAAYNTDLSLRRAEAVKAYLVSNGIDTNDIKTAGVGESQPSADNVTAEGRTQNRRVEIEVTPTAK
jgi:OOP family OmpA-OmpF porin